ncbi:MAG: DUF4810 domain-containing protein [Nitrospirales bacterium]|nr:DUF4810 domain-containing protein [Nitrospirales bacterium]MBA3754202.1 DUF4810 domain-containing protein [Nitrospira sp.]
MTNRLAHSGLTVFFLALSACVPQQYYWGSYENTLYDRHVNPSPTGQAEAITSIEAFIAEADMVHGRIPPGVYADYGYLLFKQGRTDDALLALKKESELYQESKPLMDRMISRIESKWDLDTAPEEKKPSP